MSWTSTATKNSGLGTQWVRDGIGVAHAVRESDGDHHSTLCGKYARGVMLDAAIYMPMRCRECDDRVAEPVVRDTDEEPPPEALTRAHGNGCKRHNGRIVQ